MKLLLMRHAKALPRDSHIFKDDSTRPLSDKGEKEHKQISKVMLEMGLTFDRILSSPYDRAKETAKITKKVFDIGEKMERSELLADRFSVMALIAHLKNYDQNETILLVGHEPDMSVLANALLRPGVPMSIDFKKSGIMGLSFSTYPDKGNGTLEFFLRPRLLRALEKR